MAALSLAPSRAGTHAATASAAKPWDPWTQATLTGDWNGARQKLIDQGLTITPAWCQEVFGNPTGGIRQGVVGSGELDFALDADTAKLTGWAEGGLFHANFYYIYGRISTPRMSATSAPSAISPGTIPSACRTAGISSRFGASMLTPNRLARRRR